MNQNLTSGMMTFVCGMSGKQFKLDDFVFAVKVVINNESEFCS